MEEKNLPINRPLNKVIPETLGILIIVLAGLIGGFIIIWADAQIPAYSIYYPTEIPKPDDQASDWQTYTDPQWGVSFKYPEYGSRDQQIYVMDKENNAELCVGRDRVYGPCRDSAINLCVELAVPFCHSIIPYEKLPSETNEEAFLRTVVKLTYPETDCIYFEESKDMSYFKDNPNIKVYVPKTTTERLDCEQYMSLFNGMRAQVVDIRRENLIFDISIGQSSIFGDIGHAGWLNSINFIE